MSCFFQIKGNELRQSMNIQIELHNLIYIEKVQCSDNLTNIPCPFNLPVIRVTSYSVGKFSEKPVTEICNCCHPQFTCISTSTLSTFGSKCYFKYLLSDSFLVPQQKSVKGKEKIRPFYSVFTVVKILWISTLQT